MKWLKIGVYWYGTLKVPLVIVFELPKMAEKVPETILACGSIAVTVTLALELAANELQLVAGPIIVVGCGGYFDNVRVEPDVLLQIYVPIPLTPVS